jgi:hypothetical protein
MRHLKRMVLPVQIIALFVLPIIMITIITATFAGCISLLTPLTFSDVTSSTPMWVFNFFTGIAFFVSVGQWMWEEK